jgi:hypothetical protein
MDNFDLKKFLIENKVTTNSKLNENSVSDIISTLKEKENVIVNDIKNTITQKPESTEQDIKQWIKDDSYEYVQGLIPAPSKYSGDWRAETNKYDTMLDEWTEEVYSKYFQKVNEDIEKDLPIQKYKIGDIIQIQNGKQYKIYAIPTPENPKYSKGIVLASPVDGFGGVKSININTDIKKEN